MIRPSLRLTLCAARWLGILALSTSAVPASAAVFTGDCPSRRDSAEKASPEILIRCVVDMNSRVEDLERETSALRLVASGQQKRIADIEFQICRSDRGLREAQATANNERIHRSPCGSREEGDAQYDRWIEPAAKGRSTAGEMPSP